MPIASTPSKLEQKVLKLSKDMRYLEDFVQGVSHDLNGALLVLKGQLMLMEKYETNAEKARALEEIKGAGERMSSILETMSELAAYQRGSFREVKICHLNDEMTKVKYQLQDKIILAQPKWNIDFLAAPGIKFHAPYISTIFSNLLSNALKYRDESRQLVISVKSYKEGPYLVLEFQDNGIGIDLDRFGALLFEPYQRFCYDRPGKGIGLSFVQKIVRDTGGHVKVNSVVGQGTCFTVYLKPISTVGNMGIDQLD